ncbi:glycosyltransferase [Shimazuella sp. AN120528]|uniref:glycosyltransferase n=1 Tax=Shimazuella soli TaxID=1892854 RepID=UPI001F108331|nr:glycosyltransferase [Shimazuella soli]MCH5584324.1 glycosyltransferase [Shimazuella soli]
MVQPQSCLKWELLFLSSTRNSTIFGRHWRGSKSSVIRKTFLEIYVVNDGSFRGVGQEEKREKFEKLLSEYANLPNWTVITGHPNEGKRRAQDRAFQLAKMACSYIYFVDSDCLPNKHIIRQFLAKMADGVMGVCGNMGVSNPAASWMTRLLVIRYMLGTSVERASESIFGYVWLVPGPASFYSTAFLEEVWEDYQNQRYKGKLCKNGDDLYLTNRCTQMGYPIAYNDQAVVTTNVPVTLSGYLIQQARWNRDKYRDCAMTLRSAYKAGWYPLLAGVNRMIFPFLFLITSVLCLVEWMVCGNTGSGLALALMILIRAMITYLAVRDIKGMSMATALHFTVMYGAIHTILLLPVKVWSLLTRGAGTWKR